MMLLSKEFKLHITEEQENITSHLGYVAYKLWNTIKFNILLSKKSEHLFLCLLFLHLTLT